MPYLTDEQLAEELARSSRRDAELARYEEQDSLGGVGVAPAMGSMGAAALIGFLRSKLEDPATGQWTLPGTKWDAEAVAFVALAGVALGGKYLGLGDYRGYAAVGAVGVGCHLAGEMARRFGKTGKIDFSVGHGVPPWDPTSFDPTQFAAPYDDEAARGLASSGV